MTTAPSRNLVRSMAFVPIAMLVIAVFEMPYGFYTLLRLVVTAAALLIAWHEWAIAGRSLWLIVMGLIALIFNPIVPVYLTREIWFFIDLAVSAIFAAYVVMLPKRDSDCCLHWTRL